MPQQFSQLTFRIRFGTRHRLFNPSVYLHSLTKAKLLDLKPLVLYCLLVATHANITVPHNFFAAKVLLFPQFYVLDHSQSFFLVLIDCTIRFCIPAAKNLMNYSRDELPIFILIHIYTQHLHLLIKYI